jgi:CBS domain-containing protein
LPASVHFGDRDWHPISEIVNPNIAVLRDDAPSRQVIRTLVRRGVERVYVVDDAGCLVGMVTMSDVLRRLVADEL